MNDYIILAVVAVIGIGGGLALLRAARQWRRRRIEVESAHVTPAMKDVNAWAIEQARLLRAGRFDRLDVEGIADEIEAVGQRERRALAESLVVLLAQLLQGAHPLARRGVAWEKTITAHRKEIRYALEESPSLATKLQEPRWLDMVWARAIAQAVNETGLAGFPESCPWAIQGEALSMTWWPTRSL